MADASAAVGLAPATPQTPGQDPVTHVSDNDSTGGLMETVDENPNDTCNVKQWMLFSEATRDQDGTTMAQTKSEGEVTSGSTQKGHVRTLPSHLHV